MPSTIPGARAISASASGLPPAAATTIAARDLSSASSVTSAVLSSSTTGLVGNVLGSPNRLLYTGDVTAAPPPAPTTDPVTSPPPTGLITTTVTVRYSTTGQPIVSVRWAGATTGYVDIYRNGARIINTPNDGLWSDRPRTRGTYIYKVCNSGSTTCSLDVPLTI